MSAIETTFSAVDIDSVTPLEIGEGCYRRDLPSRNGVRIWIVDMEPGAEWPHVDLHDQSGEDVFVFSGELIEGERRLGAGSFLAFSPFSKHRPRTETGVRLFGINLLPGS